MDRHQWQGVRGRAGREVRQGSTAETRSHPAPFQALRDVSEVRRDLLQVSKAVQVGRTVIDLRGIAHECGGSNRRRLPAQRKRCWNCFMTESAKCNGNNCGWIHTLGRVFFEFSPRPFVNFSRKQ